MNRKVLFTVLKLAFLCGALWWLSRKVDLQGVGVIFSKANPSTFAGGLLLLSCTGIIAGYRWFLLLRAIGVPISLRSLISIVYVGQFFALFVPGTAGDDVTRALYISRLAPQRIREVLTTVVIDRGLGMCSIFLVAMVSIPFNWEVLAAHEKVRWGCTVFFGAGLLVFLGCLGFFVLPKPHLETLIHWVRQRLARSKTAQDVCAVASALILRRAAVLGCLLGGLTTQVVISGVFCVAARAVGVNLPLLAWMSFVPIILLSNLLPITFAGVGVRDYLLLLFIPATLASPDRVLASSLSVLAIGMVGALFGGVIYVFYRPAAKADAVLVEAA